MARVGWALVETLEPTGLSVVAREREPRPRTSFERLVADQVEGGKAPGAEAANWLRNLIEGMRAQPTPVTASRTLRNRQTLTARLIPVIGPDSELYGVHLWLSPTDTPPDAAPLSAFGFSWDNQLRRAVIPPALAAGTPRTTLTAPEILRFIEPDDVLSLFRALLSGEPGTRWEGAVTMNVSRARVPAQMVMTAGAAEAESHLWRGLLFETAPPDGVRTASLEAAALAAIPRMTSMHMAILDVAKMRLLRWVTDPMPDVQWKGMVDQRDTPHPEDVKRIFEAVEPMFKGEIESGSVEGVRLRRRGGGWVVTNCSGALMRTGTDGPLLLIAQIHVLGYSDEPDPVAASDLGHPGLDDPAYPRHPVK